MDTVLWSIGRADGLDILGTLWRPFLIGMVLYYSGYPWVWISTLLRSARLVRPFTGLASGAPGILVVIPTLLKTRADVDDLRAAAETVVGNRYPGEVVLCMSIDGTDGVPELIAELERWANSYRGPARVLVARVPQRSGKGVAVHAGLERAKQAVRDGELRALPPVFFNMDADGVLSEGALERMVARLVRPGRIFRRRPMIVASNVMVRKAHYWSGWRGYFTMRGQLALQVAREYMTSISITRNNRGILPVTGVSGALYATWTELHDEQARYASFLQSLRLRDVIAWWFGARPPSFAAFRGPENVRATAGPGDDTWVAWMAMAARWRGGRLDLELPRSPLHALGRLFASFWVRAIAYDPLARVYTATPTTARALFKQRVRWNTSRRWLLRRFGWMPYFSWNLGFWVITDVSLVIFIHVVILVGLLAWPLADRPATWMSLMILGMLANLVIRGAATLLAMVQDHDVRGHWHKLLALPLAGVFHFVFNIATTIVGFVHDVLLFGINTHFAPEETLEASKTGRPAIAYRIARCSRLVWRALRWGDVPAGRFWFGWGATRWTRNGYAGWTNRKNKIGRGGVLPSPQASQS
jgi:cellulose synthase/poly-beta-1,6-N-acetylglucosamine synthase-like glycosyltransferase